MFLAAGLLEEIFGFAEDDDDDELVTFPYDVTSVTSDIIPSATIIT
jgi:hypothetical protein